MSEIQKISDSLTRLVSHIEKNNYRGYDPYDGLSSPLFDLPVLKSNKQIRFASQQFIKRFPINFRHLLAIPKGYNPVTLGLCLQGYAYLIKNFGIRIEDFGLNASPSPLHPFTQSHLLERINFLIAELKSLISPGYHGSCWGYNFPWEARYASIPAFGPTVVATGIITNALYSTYKITGSEECAGMVKDAAEFVLHDLNKNIMKDTHIYSYSPYDRQQVFNASMKGARILSQAYSVTGNVLFKEEAIKAVRYVIRNQKEDGSWSYSMASKGEWTDNYHTGYILDCLHEYINMTGDSEYNQSLKKGYEFYISHFIGPEGKPRFYSDKTYPVDCTAAAQTILTLIRFGDIEKAKEVAEFMIGNMQAPSGGFYFRKYKHCTNRTVFMRWSNAWMFSALAALLSLERK